MKETNITCICCPMGCAITLCSDNAGAIASVSGNSCPRGEKYARQEYTCPERMVTGSVALRGGVHARVSVKTAATVPKDRVMDVARAIRELSVCAPVAIGDVLVADIAATGVALVATRNGE